MEVENRFMAKFMREELHISYKKTSSHPLKLDTKKQQQFMILLVDSL